MRVSCRRLDFEDAVFNREERNIERATAYVLNEDISLTARLVQTVGDCRGSWFVDHSQHVEARNRTCILCF